VIPTFFALALPAAVCTGALRVYWPAAFLGRANSALLVSMGAGCGVGLASCHFFLWYPAFGHPDSGFVPTELLLLAGLAAFVYQRVKRPAGAGPTVFRTAPSSCWAGRMWVPFVGLAALAVRHVVCFFEVEPHGAWDAYGFWNTRARCLYRGTEAWRDAFSPLQDHADYPLFLPATIARCWLYADDDATTGPIIVALLMATLTAGVLISALSLLRGGGQGWLGGMALLGAVGYVADIGIQYADVPLGFFILATAVALVLHDRTGRTSRLFPVLAGAFAGLAAWTKNEGLLFLAAVPVARCVIVRLGPGVRAFLPELAGYVLGLLPAGLTLLYFKLAIAPPNDLLASERPTIWGMVTDWDRHELIIRALASAAWDLGRFLLPVLIAYALLIGRAPAARRGPGIATVVSLLLLMGAGYYLIYLTTPHDLRWHLETSLDRLLAQLWPLMLFGYFLLVATPDERAGTVPEAPPVREQTAPAP
jgi:hypothetical protein